MKFSMTCDCGDTMGIEANTREEAVMKMKSMMTQDAIDAHMAQRHPGRTMTVAQVHMGIEKDLVAA